MDNDEYKVAKKAMGYHVFRDVYHSKMIVDLSWVMFTKISSGNPVDCTEYGGSASQAPSINFPLWIGPERSIDGAGATTLRGTINARGVAPWHHPVI
jgi:hypothetical protein